MNSAVVFLALMAAVSAVVGDAYSPNPYNAFNRNQYRYKPYSTPAPYRFPTVTYAPTIFAPTTPAPARVVVPVARYADGYNAETLKYGNDNAPDGSFNYFYETSNGIAAQAQGTPRNFGGNPPVAPVVVGGNFAWTSPEGVPVAISYVADENGYQPTGSAIPTSPPIPAQIARALEYTLRNVAQKK